jgi:hypothetical protein
VLKFGVKTPINKNNSSSLILTNLDMKFEACMLGSEVQKNQKKEKTI